MAKNAIITQKLDFWVKTQKNVLFMGRHGVGKSAIVKDTFERHKLNYRYFSASTMDPWVDFVGVPREKTIDKLPKEFEIIKELANFDKELAIEWVQSNWKMSKPSAKTIVDRAILREEGTTFLELVRPESFATDQVEALFFDEFNRSPKKIRNAVMELMQFKSINGKKFPNLKMIWAAINPEDDEELEYDVEKLDPAQADRFHIKVGIEYAPNAEWFRAEYGNKIANSALLWWNELTPEAKNDVSPRRLQYALNIFREHGDMRDALPLSCNVQKLAQTLEHGSPVDKLESLMKSKDTEAAKLYLSNENNCLTVMKLIPKAPTLMEYFLPLLPMEKMTVAFSTDDKICDYMLENSDKVPVFMQISKNLLKANTNAKLTAKIRKLLTSNEKLSQAFANSDENNPDVPFFNNGKKEWKEISKLLTDASVNKTVQDKLDIYDGIVNSIPEKMNGNEALECLQTLDYLFGENELSPTITMKPFEKLMGIFNHCTSELSRNTKLDWAGILSKHGNHFKNLLAKIKSAGMENRIQTQFK